MNYGYTRVSTDKQENSNQRFEILTFSNEKKLHVDEWVEEIVSGTKAASDRELGKLIDKVKKGDTIIISEISRIGRSLFEIMEVLSRCMKKEVFVYSIKESLNLDNNLTSQMVAFAYSLSAQLEKQLISQRTKEALNKKKAEGKILGRPKGSKNKTTKLTGKETEINGLLAKKVSVTTIGRIYGVNRATIKKFVLANPSTT